MEWQPIATAPKDGTPIIVMSKGDTFETVPGEPPTVRPPRAYIATWNPDGDSWTDEDGNLEGEICVLTVTGIWASGHGWFQPNEVTHWLPIPPPPKTT